MANMKFNEPQFELRCVNLDDGTLRIVSFEGSEQISGLYEYRFRLLSEDPSLDTKDILNCNATFTLSRGDEKPQKINGIISNFKQLGRTPDYVSYQAVLVPRLWRLLLTKQSKIFQNMNIEVLITQVLKDAGFGSSDYEFKLDKAYPTMEFIVQYQDTDLNFIHRRLEHLGIFYFFDHRDDIDVIVFCDANDSVMQIEANDGIIFNPNQDPFSAQETITQLIHDESVVTGQVQLKDYNYEFPSRQLLVESKLDKNAPGTQYSYGDHFKNESEGEFLARIRNEEIMSKSSIFTGKGDCRLFQAGYVFQLTKHYRDDWNKEYLLTKVISRGNQRGLFAILPPSTKVESSYENKFEAIPQNFTFRPPRTALHPKIYGVMHANIDAAGTGDHAEIDDKGRYKVILPLDLSGKIDGTASHYIRMIQPYAGPDYGMHFPLHKGTEVLLTFIDGDPDRPVISGAVPNPETISPVTSANQKKSVIRDHYGNEMVLDATTADEHIRLHSPHHNSTIEIGRSIVTSTDGDWFSWEVGNKVELTGGNKFEGFAGNIAEAKIGMALDVLLGLSYQFEAAGKHSLLLGYDAGLHWGPEFKFHKGPTIEKSDNDKTSIAAGDNILSAQQVLSLVGGARSDPGDTAIINLKDKTIELTIGSNKNPDTTSAQKWVKGLLIASPIATTIVASIFATLMTPALALPDDTGALRYGLAGTAGTIEGLLILANILTVSILGNLGLRDSIRPVSHFDANRDAIRSIIKMEKEGGVTLGTLPDGKGNDLNEMDNKLVMSNTNGVKINSKTNQILLGVGNEGKEGSIIKLTKDGISIIGGKGKSEIELDGNGNVKIYAEGNIEFAKCGEIKFHNYAKLDGKALNFTGTKKIKSACFEAG